MNSGAKAVMLVGLALLLFGNGDGRLYAQSENRSLQNGATVESRYGGTYDAQLASQDSWIEGLTIVQARDYGADLIVSGAVVSTFGSFTAWAFSSAFDTGIANFEPGNVTTATYIGIGAIGTIGLLGLTMVVIGVIDVIMADQILVGDS